MTVVDHLEEALLAGAPDYTLGRQGAVQYSAAQLAALLRWALAMPDAAEQLACGLEALR